MSRDAKTEAALERLHGWIRGLVQVTEDPERIRRLCEEAIKDGEETLRDQMAAANAEP